MFGPASGPGGQHVNRAHTRVELRFDIAGSPSLPDPVRARLLERLAGRLDPPGVLAVRSQRTRSQHRNREDALERMIAILTAALAPRRPRVATSPPPAARARRLAEKKRRSALKRERRTPPEED
ncbi:MAG: aminoacyl-tRNA hydrolase [Acidobacteria bacterium]|nr:MAG: aminoacyl-tRNA hydrolase [Acidobacteriota bacterium]